jgi:hypothetical protein
MIRSCNPARQEPSLRPSDLCDSVGGLWVVCTWTDRGGSQPAAARRRDMHDFSCLGSQGSGSRRPLEISVVWACL